MNRADPLPACVTAILVIPTLEGRKTVAETILSVASCGDLFSDIVISVNGLSSDYVSSLVERSGLRIVSRVHLLSTQCYIPATQHADFICKYLRLNFAGQTPVFLLADDDLVPSRLAISDYMNACLALPFAVGMGNLVSFVDDKDVFLDEIQHVLPGENIPVLEFLRRNKHGHLTTSMSSMVVSNSVLCDCVSFVAFWGSAGRRFEYLLATHRSVSVLFSPCSASAMIRQHPDQEGRVLSVASERFDELIYICWVWLNQPMTRPWRDFTNAYGFGFVRLFKVLISVILSMLLNQNTART